MLSDFGNLADADDSICTHVLQMAEQCFTGSSPVTLDNAHMS